MTTPTTTKTRTADQPAHSPKRPLLHRIPFLCHLSLSVLLLSVSFAVAAVESSSWGAIKQQMNEAKSASAFSDPTDEEFDSVDNPLPAAKVVPDPNISYENYWIRIDEVRLREHNYTGKWDWVIDFTFLSDVYTKYGPYDKRHARTYEYKAQLVLERVRPIIWSPEEVGFGGHGYVYKWDTAPWSDMRYHDLRSSTKTTAAIRDVLAHPSWQGREVPIEVIGDNGSEEKFWWRIRLSAQERSWHKYRFAWPGTNAGTKTSYKWRDLNTCVGSRRWVDIEPEPWANMGVLWCSWAVGTKWIDTSYLTVFKWELYGDLPVGTPTEIINNDIRRYEGHKSLQSLTAAFRQAATTDPTWGWKFYGNTGGRRNSQVPYGALLLDWKYFSAKEVLNAVR